MIELPFAPRLATKLHAPRPRRALVSRPRLMARLEEGFARPLTLLVAPAGFGKTTLIGAWVAQSGHPMAWLSLDAGDNDPTRFWGYVIAALESLHPGIGQSALSLLGCQGGSGVQMTLTALINAVETLPEEFGLILDDYHVIENPAIDEALAFLLGRIPAHMHITVATRADPSLPLARLRARDELVELRAADLRFNTDETGHFLRTAMQLPLGLAEVAALEARTEGWIAGLQLAGLALRGQEATDIADFISASVSSNRFVVDYLVEEVLQSQSAEVQDFLRQTSILDRLCAPLCDAVTGRSDGQVMLDYLEHTNLFLVPLDPEAHWYRYHNLFGDVLGKLLGQESPDRVPELHRRAAAWLETHSLMREAIGHALAMPDYETAARMIEQVGMAALNRGEVVTVLGWLRSLPSSVLCSRPRLCLAYATAQIIAGELQAVEPLLQGAEQAIAPDSPPALANDLQGQIAAIRAILASRAGDTPRVIELTGLALDCLPESRAFLRGLTSWIRGLAYTRTGDQESGDQIFSEALGLSHLVERDAAAALSLYTFGFLEQRQGRLRQARELYRQAMAALDEQDEQLSLLGGQVFIGMGEVLRLQNDLEAAEDYLQQGLRLCACGHNADTAVHGYISLAWLRQARGDSEGALAALETAIRCTQGQLVPDTQALLHAHRARLLIAQGDVLQAEQWALERRLRVLNETGDRGGTYTRHFELLTWARLLIAQRRPTEALAVLERVLDQATRGSRLHTRINTLVLMALARHILGETPAALAILGEALAMAAREGYIRNLVDDGAPVMALLMEGRRAQAWPDPVLAGHVDRLLAADIRPAETALVPAGARPAARMAPSVAITPAAAARSPLIEPLTQREIEVLRLVVAGLDNRAIAERLVLSVGTVKSHIHSIYGKLGVQDRSQAVLQAQALGLL